MADDLQRRNLRPVVILLAAESFGGQPGSQKIASQLMEQRVPVCMIYCDADLTQALSAFSSNNTITGCDLMAKTDIVTLDLNFQGKAEAIAVYLIRHSSGAVLIESGPGSTQAALQAGLAANGLSISDVTHVLLTHIHLDHAGAAGWLAQQGAQIYVHPVGAPHMLQPGKVARQRDADLRRPDGDSVGRVPAGA